jgi:predicted permease
MFKKHPGFTAIAVISLALGIGANAAIFSLVNTVLLRPLPVEKPEELVALNSILERGGNFPSFSYPDYRDLRDRNDVLAGLILYRIAPVNLSHDGLNERVWGYLVSGNYFEMLGVKAGRGRLLSPEDDRKPGAHPVAVISYNCWQKRFAGDPNVAGKGVIVNGRNYTIIGVTPRGFTGTELAYVPEIWFPVMMLSQIEPGADWLESRDTSNSFVVGRLKPGVSMIQAESSLKAIAAQLAREFPNTNEGKSIALSRPGLFGAFMRGPVVWFAGALMVVVALVLLLACTNLANLLLARASERRKEIAIRLALGAGRFRLVRQLLTESVALAILGGLLGFVLAYWMVDLANAFRPPIDIPITTEIRIDWRVLVFSGALSLATGILFGLLPAFQATNPNLIPALKDETSVGGYRRSWLRNTLVVGQITLSLILLICAGLVVRSLQRAQFMNPGFIPQNAVEASFSLDLQGYDEARGRVFQRQALERVRALPGVQSAGLTNWVPLSLNINSSYVYIEGHAPQRGGNIPLAMNNRVSTGYFQAMGIRFLQGRDFTDQDKPETPRVAIVNQTFARRFWEGQNAIGKRFSFEGVAGPWTEVIGVVQDGKYFSLSEEPEPFVYRPMSQGFEGWNILIARTAGDPQNVMAAMRREIQALDPTLPIYDVKTMMDHMNLPLLPARVAGAVLGSFGVLALILAAIGIFGVMSYAVSQRTREIGVRMALGAGAKEIFKFVVGEGLLLTLIGMAIGLALAVMGTRFLSILLYGVSAVDPLTFAGVSLLLAAVAFLACYFPARRAMKIDPITALRHE